MKKFQKSKKTAISEHRENHSGRSLMQLPQLCPDIQLPPFSWAPGAQCHGFLQNWDACGQHLPADRSHRMVCVMPASGRTQHSQDPTMKKVKLGVEQIVNAWEEYESVILKEKKRKKKKRGKKKKKKCLPFFCSANPVRFFLSFCKSPLLSTAT